MPRHDLPTGTVTFLFTDIEGSTRLLHALGPEVYAAELEEHRVLLRGAFAAAAGIEVDTQGDAFFVAFSTAAGAAEAAAAAHASLASGRVRVRIGLHTGTPQVTEDGYVGEDVHRGARIAALAHGGQTLASAATTALLDDAGSRDLGLHRLKDFEGATRVYQLGAGDFAPLRSPGSVDLPTPATPFLGRQRELLDAIAVVLERNPRVLTIVGPGGTGKTRFAIELARLLADEAEGGTVFLPLAALRDTDLLIPAVAERLGAASADIAAIGARVGGRRTHIVLDNVEQLLPDAAPALATLTAAAPALRLLVTSREALRIQGEEELDLPPLVEDDAVELFLARARAVRPGVERTPAVAELCARLDRLPLAIELAAARTKLLSPEALLARLGARLDLLRGTRDSDPRHATLEATIAWSYDLLDEREQRLFARLAVFRGGCTPETAEEVCDADLDTIASLLDKSLLRRRTEPDRSDRYWMLETIREFATARLAGSGEERDIQRRHAQWLLELVRRTRASVPTEVADQGGLSGNLLMFAPELDNVRAVLGWSLEHDVELGLELAAALEQFWVIHEPLEGAAWLERLLEAAPSAERPLRAAALRALAGALDIYGEHEAAAPILQASLALFEEIGDEHGATNLRFRVGCNLANIGKTGEAWPLIEAAYADFRRLGQRVGEAQVLSYLGWKADLEGDAATAQRLHEESAAIAHEFGWTWWELHELMNLSELERRRGKLKAAEGYARRSLALATEIGDRMATVFSTAELASTAAAQGEAATAGRMWGAIESEEAFAPIGQWSRHREGYEQLVFRAAGAVFDEAREEGKLLSLAEAAGIDEAQTLP